ncbi:hypothetical protein [Phormidium nigroviride]
MLRARGSVKEEEEGNRISEFGGTQKVLTEENGCYSSNQVGFEL